MQSIYGFAQGSRLLFLSPFILVAVVLTFVHCSTPENGAEVELSELQKRALAFTQPLPEDAFLEGMNRLDELIELGKMLFYEPRLSKSGLISCNTCHNMATFGVDQLPVSIGHMWREGRRNAPTVLNAAFHTTQFWDGREPDVESQALMPILDELEMASTRRHVVAVLRSMPEYVDIFKLAFPEQDNPVIYRNVGIAIGAFERTLITHSRFDDYLRGDDSALSDAEKKGLATFIDTGCQSCHGGQALGGRTFSMFKTPAELASGEADDGRFEVTGNQLDKNVFKVPSLLNITKTYPYFHDGSEWSLGETVNVVAKDMLQRELTPEQNDEIVTFLAALTGEIPAYALELPILPPSTPETPRPVFD